jgi:O-antigen ligase
VNGAVRVTTGCFLFVMTFLIGAGPEQIHRRVTTIWSAAAAIAAAYGIGNYLGFWSAGVFRNEDFFFGPVLRLSGSFEYPTPAAAYFAMSLPMVAFAPIGMPYRAAGGLLVWTALLLTYSRGAMAAVIVVFIVFIGWTLLRKGSSPFRRLSPAAAIALALLASGPFILAPRLATRILSVGSETPFDARYEIAFTGLGQRPSVVDTGDVTVFNTGGGTWFAEGPEQAVLSYRWYDADREELLDEEPGRITNLPRDIRPGESVTLSAAFETPPTPGNYLLIWDLRTGGQWFSRMRIDPTFAEVKIALDAVRQTDRRSLDHWLPEPPDDEATIEASVPRSRLWTAAIDMFAENPLLGVGPDNYRLIYGRYLEVSDWDTNIRSNNLYLELLATVGVLGLGAFLAFGFLVFRRGRGTSAPAVAIALGVFFVHGLVDVFLMTTPIYFGFWILAGLAAGSRTGTRIP